MTRPDDSLDRVIHEPARLKLMTLLFVVDEADFTYLSDQTGLTAGNLSTHMTKLEQAGYVTVDKSFAGRRPRTVYRLTNNGRDALVAYRHAMDDMLWRIDPAN